MRQVQAQAIESPILLSSQQTPLPNPMNRFSAATLRRLFVLIAASIHAFYSYAASDDTSLVFERYKERLVQIRVLDSASGARVSLGSGFIVSSDGLIITNYHVVSDLIQKPSNYRADILHHNGTIGKPRLLRFDIVHDLALIQTNIPIVSWFDFSIAPPRKGARVFSLGTPLDLGFTIVEGTYSGLIEESLYEQVHFTGSINAGMSGGPAILANGTVVGINVASMGDQVSFLVPAKFAKSLVDDAKQNVSAAQENLAKATQQLLNSQNDYIHKLLASPLPTTVLGKYKLPGQAANYLKCWGDSQRHEVNLFEIVSWECSAQNDLYLSRTQTISPVWYRHELISSTKLNPLRFYNLYQNYFLRGGYGFQGGSDDVGPFSCTTEFVANVGLEMKAVFCLRAYKKLLGLYDAVLRVATLGGNTEGVQSTLMIQAVSAESATRFSAHYLEAMTWTK